MTETSPTSSARPLLPLLLATLAWPGGCAGVPTDPDRAATQVNLAATDRPVERLALPAGTLLQLRPVVVNRDTERSRVPPEFLLNGWWRIAMRQSARFDVAAGAEDCPSPHRIQLHLDPGSQCFTTTLVRDGSPPLALAAVCGAAPDAAVDRLAWLTRAALGEHLDMRPIRCTDSYSPSRECVKLTELGLQRRTAGDAGAAVQLFERARSFDGGCTFTLLHLAATLANVGGEGEARRAHEIASEALRFRRRLTPHAEHRLARVLLLVARDDARLLELGRSYQSDRPHDAHGAYSVGLALNKSGNYAKSLPILKRLRARWPVSAGLRYQLCFAMLATGDSASALEALDEAKSRLPANAIVRPYAMALFHSAKHDELRRYLSEVRRRQGVRSTPAEREIIRMQASHALLTGDRNEAIRKIAEGLAWARQHSSDLRSHTLDVAEDGEVLVRLGATDVARQAIAGFHQLGQLPGTFADALTYLGGLLTIQANQDPKKALETLDKAHATVWHSQLQAALHHRRGELDAEIRALERAVDASTSPLLQASVARALYAAGKKSDAKLISTHVQGHLLAFDQRKPYEHPLMTPSHALAHLATK